VRPVKRARAVYQLRINMLFVTKQMCPLLQVCSAPTHTVSASFCINGAKTFKAHMQQHLGRLRRPQQPQSRHKLQVQIKSPCSSLAHALLPLLLQSPATVAQVQAAARRTCTHKNKASPKQIVRTYTICTQLVYLCMHSRRSFCCQRLQQQCSKRRQQHRGRLRRA
jgi:hypothetical protein